MVNSFLQRLRGASRKFPQLNFQVVSKTTGEVYYIELTKNGDNLRCTCTCPAAQNGLHCKHRIGILEGDNKIVESGDVDKMHNIPEMLKDTELEATLIEYRRLESAKAELDKQLKGTKKKLGRLLAE